MSAVLAAREVKAGMTVQFKGIGSGPRAGVWHVLDRHPIKAHWWLHRWNGDEWESTYARYSELEQVITDDRESTG